MFGYVAANPQMLTEEETRRYRAVYCGLCRSLGERHGQLSRLSLTYDMTFLALFLNAMYEPAERSALFRCVVHPKGTHERAVSPYTAYAADMNVLLAYLNCMDNWQDDRNVAALLESRIFKKSYESVQKQYPRQTETIRREMEALSCLERAQCPDPEQPANCFGRLLGELFVVDERDYFAEELRQFGFYLGKFVYLCDACMDYEQDKRRGSYNPLVLCTDGTLDEAWARQMLTMYLSACVEIFRRLPIVQDAVIIQNILFSGVWQAFDKRFPPAGMGSTKE